MNNHNITMEEAMIKAHSNQLKPMITGAICFMFMVIMLAHGCVQMVVAQ